MVNENGNALRGEFLKGINIHAPESRDYCLEIIEFLRRTPIEWLRIHPLPSRRIRAKGIGNVSHLDSIAKYAEAGFNLIIPIDVGVKENVGVITGANLRSFVDDSYGEAFKAVKQIESRTAKYRTRIIYGVENEIDTKEWILQSMPNVAWREEPLTWMRLSVDRDLKFKRLRHILDGVRDAAPDCLTMVNFEADDPAETWNLEMSFMLAAQSVFSKLGFLEKDARSRMNNYKLDIEETIQRLKQIDAIGLDNYPNYFSKIPPKGHGIGSKVDEVSRLFRKPVINVEFGYTTLGRGIRRFKIFGNPADLETARRSVTPSPPQLQKQFFQNALDSIENSSSQGTFPWVLFLDPAHGYRPREEDGFTLLEIGANRLFEPLPAMDHYLSWLDAMKSRELQNFETQRDGEEESDSRQATKEESSDSQRIERRGHSFS